MVLKDSSYNQPCKNFWANETALWIKLSAAQAWVQSLEHRSRCKERTNSTELFFDFRMCAMELLDYPSPRV